MNEKKKYSYFYKGDQKKRIFYQIPQTLIIDEEFKNYSLHCKVLYSILLNRTSLSEENNWLDSEGRVFVYLSREEASGLLGCTVRSITKYFSELEEIGLIERIKIGMNPTKRIYVKDFDDNNKTNDSDCISPAQDEREKISLRTGKNFPSKGKKFPPNNNKYNNNKYNNNNEGCSCNAANDLKSTITEEKFDFTSNEEASNLLVLTPPTLDEALSYGRQAGRQTTEIKEFYNYFSKKKWTNFKGQAITNWKLFMDWCFTHKKQCRDWLNYQIVQDNKIEENKLDSYDLNNENDVFYLKNSGVLPNDFETGDRWIDNKRIPKDKWDKQQNRNKEEE